MLELTQDPRELSHRARRPLIAAAALASAVLAPLVNELVLGSLATAGRMGMDELLTYWVWGALLAALFGGLVMRTALAPGRGPGAALGFAVLAGIVYPVCLLAPMGLVSLAHSRLEQVIQLVVIGPIAITLVGLIASVPAGLGFGLAFFAGALRARSFLDRPGHDQVAHGYTSAVAVLGVAALGAWPLAAMIEGGYCQAIFLVILPALDVVPPEGTDLAWTRLLLPTPLLGAALGALALGWHEQRRVDRLARALEAGAHPRLVLDEIATEASDDAAHDPLPLREEDFGAKLRRLVRERDAGSPFRASGRALAFVAAPAVRASQRLAGPLGSGTSSG